MPAEMKHSNVPRLAHRHQPTEVLFDIGASRCLLAGAIIHQHGDVLRRKAVALCEKGVHGLDIIDAPTQLG